MSNAALEKARLFASALKQDFANGATAPSLAHRMLVTLADRIDELEGPAGVGDVLDELRALLTVEPGKHAPYLQGLHGRTVVERAIAALLAARREVTVAPLPTEILAIRAARDFCADHAMSGMAVTLIDEYIARCRATRAATQDEHRIEQVETTDGPDRAVALFNRLGAEGWQFAGVLRRLVSTGPFRSFDECVFTRAATQEPRGFIHAESSDV